MSNAPLLQDVITNNSVEATARLAGNLGFTTVVVSNTTATFARPDFNDVLRSAEEVHALSLANLQDEYAAIMTTQEVLDVLTRSGSRNGIRHVCSKILLRGPYPK